MSKPTFTFPGKLGDALMQWPVAAQYARHKEKQIDVWLDEKTCKPLVPLIEVQPLVSSVELKPGIENYNCGGQPWHFNLKTSEFKDRAMYHMGMRSFPQRQITLETAENVKLPINIDREALRDEPSLSVGEVEPRNRVILHGQPVFVHNRQTPQFWKFLSSIAGDLEEEFEEIVFVGNDRDREISARAYPNWKTFDDESNFLNLAKHMAAARLVIGTGSCVVTLGDALKIPTIRVHDPIGTHPKVVWSGLAKNQLNEEELALRTMWRPFFDKWVRTSAAEVVE